MARRWRSKLRAERSVHNHVNCGGRRAHRLAGYVGHLFALKNTGCGRRLQKILRHCRIGTDIGDGDQRGFEFAFGVSALGQCVTGLAVRSVSA